MADRGSTRAALVALTALVACKQSEPTPSAAVATAAPAPVAPAVDAAAPAPEAKSTWYRAELDFEKLGPLPFFVRIPDSSGEGVLKNADELEPVDVTWTGDEVQIVARINWTSQIKATRQPDGSLVGSWVRDTPLWSRVERKLVAVPVPAPKPDERFAAGAPPSADVSGVWKFDFKEHRGGKGRLEMTKDGVVTGYIRPGMLGDLRFLEGELQGTKLRLSTFNGNSANLVIGELSKDGKTLSGQMSMQNVWNEKFTATRTDDFELANRTHMKPGKTKVTVPHLDKLAGKPVVVIYFATWCPACNDATPHMVALHEKYKAQGVEFLSIAMDLSEEQTDIDEQLAAFKKKHGVTWSAYAQKTTPEKWQGAMPPEITGWAGFPLTIFVKKDGTVHSVYGGWFGPATGDENTKIKAQFDRWVSELI